MQRIRASVKRMRRGRVQVEIGLLFRFWTMTSGWWSETFKPKVVQKTLNWHFMKSRTSRPMKKSSGTLMYAEPWFYRVDTLKRQEYRGRRFEHGFSEWFKFRALIAIAKDITPEQLDNWKHRLRLTIRAMNQKPLSATHFFDWEKTRIKPTSCFPVWPRSLAMPRRDHIILMEGKP